MLNSDKFKNTFYIYLFRPTINALKEYVGHPVKVVFTDGNVKEGTLGYTKEFSEEYNYRKPDYFTVKDIDFKVSYVKSVMVAPIKTQDSGLFYSMPENPNINVLGHPTR